MSIRKSSHVGNIATGLEHVFLHTATLGNPGSGSIFEGGGEEYRLVGGCLQIWRVATNTESRTADELLSSDMGLGVGVTTQLRKECSLIKTSH
jgi:hypothetical protein